MSGWIEWHGGECPVDPDTIVDVRFNGDVIETDRASNWDWEHQGFADILAYRPTTNFLYSTPYNRRPA